MVYIWEVAVQKSRKHSEQEVVPGLGGVHRWIQDPLVDAIEVVKRRLLLVELEAGWND